MGVTNSKSETLTQEFIKGMVKEIITENKIIVKQKREDENFVEKEAGSQKGMAKNPNIPQADEVATNGLHQFEDNPFKPNCICFFGN